MPRFFIEQTVDPGQVSLRIDGEDARHIRDVLRMRPGEKLIVCDGARTDLLTQIAALDPGGVTLAIEERWPSQTESPLDIWLFQGLPKADKLEMIIQKSVELGVLHIIPVQCRRSVVRLDARDVDKKLGRWNKIAQEAAKQCGRGVLPDVIRPLTFAAAVALAGQLDMALIPWENERQQSMRQLLSAAHSEFEHTSRRSKVGIFIGPEGGFAPDEIELALAGGWQPVSLGPRILRTETAGPAVLAMLSYQFE